MTRLENSRLLDLFEEAAVLDNEERERLLERVRTHEPEYLDQLQGLLDSWSNGGLISENTTLPVPISKVLQDVAPPFSAGDREGDFSILGSLGVGAEGWVFQAFEVPIGRPVALKVLRETKSAELDGLQDRIVLAARLHHPNIVTTLMSTELGGHQTVVQEYVAGGCLAEVMKRRERLADTQDRDSERARHDWAVKVCVQVARALDHAHKHKVVHRDVKPANIILSDEGVPKLADFGLAALQGEGDITSDDLLGTVDYMSPEQAGGRPIDERTDIYSLGAVLYRLLTGRVPLEGKNVGAKLESLQTAAPRPIRERAPFVGRDLEAVCLKALHKDPSRRYASARAFGEDLEACREGRPTLARPLGPHERMLKFVRRQRIGMLGSLSSLVALGWLAGDRLLLAPLERDDTLAPRLLIVLAAAALLCLPLTALCERLLRSRQRPVIVALGATLLLTTLAGASVYKEEIAQRHAQAARTLALDIESPASESPRSSALVEDYIDTWQSRFTDADRYLVARALLKRKRLSQAASFALAMRAQDGATLALQGAILSGLGPREEAAEALARAADLRLECTPRQLEQIGDIHRDLAEFDTALSLYGEAYDRLGLKAPINLQFKLAQAYVGLCRFDEALEFLDSFELYQDDPRTLPSRMRIAIAQGDEASAEAVLERASAPDVGLDADEVLRLRLAHASEWASPEDIDALISAALADPAPSDDVIDECARARYHFATDGRRLNEASQDEILQRLDAAAAVYERLRDAPSAAYRVSALNGLAAIEFKKSNLELPDEQKLAHARRSEELARAAIAEDDDFHESHYNAGNAHKRAGLILHGGDFANLSLEALETYTRDYRHALERYGLQAQILNDTAYALTYVHGKTGERSILDEALQYTERAVRLREAEAESSCGSASAHYYLSTTLDTRRHVQIALGHRSSALASAERALEEYGAFQAAGGQDAGRLKTLQERADALRRD